MMHKRYTLRQRLIMALRSIPGMGTSSMTCPCGSSRVRGSGDGPYQCDDCGSMWQ